MKLFFVTYAGGTASFFNILAAELAGDFECVLIEYAGHASRRREPFYNTFTEMVNDVSQIITEHLQENESYSIFGYSMGSLVAYEVLTGAVKKGQCVHLFAAAHFPPHASELRKKYSKMTDEELSHEMEQFGGLDARIIANRRFLDIYLPVIRKDYQLLEEYVFSGIKKKVPCKITVFYSEEDTEYAVMRGWQEYTQDGITFLRYYGNHFFLKKQEKAVADDIRKALSCNALNI
ncbi:MAG: alpha/beta hydrolase [Lachnospiraceae bacterium]|nr:alpha/beta hydrolase [Lachnospiraceae bacterium]